MDDLVTEDDLTYCDEVQDADLERYLAETSGTVEIRPPRLSDAEDYLLEREGEARADRRRVRREGRPYAVPDARGVRGEQFAETPDVDTQIALLRQGRASVFAPYYSEGDRKDDAVLTTSWVDNVRFDLSISSVGPSVFVPDAKARRVVSQSADFIQSTFDQTGAPTAGGEYAVFAYALGADERIRSAPGQVVRIDVVARFTSGDTQVIKNLRAEALGLVLDMEEVHSILMTNADNGQPVTTSDGFVVCKSGEQLPFAPSATVVKNPARFTFKYRPSERNWMLTRVDFALTRKQLQGVPDAKAMVYLDPTWYVGGEPLDQRLVSLVKVEDPASNPLDPEVYLEVFPLRRDNSISGLPLLAGQSHRVSVRATHRLVPKTQIDATGRAIKTIYTDLPSLSIEIPDAAEIIRASPSADVSTFRVDVTRPEKQERVDFTSSELSLHSAPVSLLLAPSVEPESVYEILSMQIGPIRDSALREAIADSRKRV